MPISSTWRRIEPQLAGYDACFFCLGVSSVGMVKKEVYKGSRTI